MSRQSKPTGPGQTSNNPRQPYRLDALRSAVQIGIADIEAGRFKTFDSKETLRAHLKSITAKAIAEV